jgi:predicted RNA binding protein YcfA (HicA-like mRNA interferase family)
LAQIPLISSRECINALAKVGFAVSRQTGSHIILRREAPHKDVVVVPHSAQIPRGTLRNIIRQAKLTVDEFIALL